MSLPEIVSGDGPPPDSPMPTPPLPVITLPVIPDALTPKLDSWSPVPELLLIVLLTTPTVTLLPNVNPPLPLLCTTLFQIGCRLATDCDYRGGQLQPCEQLGVTGRARACAHQGPRSEPGEHRRELGRPSGPDDDPAGCGELERHPGHRDQLAQSVPLGNTAENFVAARGSAIISATVSRQMA